MSSENARGAGFGSQVVTLVYLALFGFTLVLILLSIPAGVYAMISGSLSKVYGIGTLEYPYLFIGPFLAFLPFRVDVGSIFFLFVGVYLALLVYVLAKGPNPLNAAREAMKSGAGSIFRSQIVVLVTSIGFLVITAYYADTIVTAAGSPVGNVPGTDPFALFYGFTVAPLIEEFGFRVCLIGALAAVVSVGRPWKEVLGAVWRPALSYEKGPAPNATRFALVAMLAASSLVFGYAHVEAGWGPGKLFEASLGGFVLGWLYIRYGFPMAVLAHWGVDYFGNAFSFYGQAAFGIPWNSDTAVYILQAFVNIDLLRIFGVASFVMVVYVGLRRLAPRGASPVTPV